MKNQPLVAVITSVHNNKEDTRAFLESLNCVTYPSYKVIITDDGSTDGTEEMIKKEYPDVILLKGDGNLWWSRATNMGIEKAIEVGTNYVLLMDNDCVVDKDFISALAETAERNPRSIIASKCYYYYDKQRIWEAGGDMRWLTGGFRLIGRDEIDNGQYDTERDVKCATMGVLIDTAVFQDIGLIDHQNFPQYKADVDFTYRAYKRGYRIIYQPRSQIWHKGSATAKKGLLAKSRRSFITSPVSTLIYSLSSKSRGTSLSLREWARFYLRHYPLYFPYISVYFAVRRLLREIKAKRH